MRKKINLETEDIQDWLRILYVEAWKQYSHEDNLEQSNTKFYVSIQTALIVISLGITKYLIDFSEYFKAQYSYEVNFLVFGFLLILLSTGIIILTYVWQHHTAHCKQYAQLRRLQLADIESVAKIKDIGLATKEIEWRKHIKNEINSNFDLSKKSKKVKLKINNSTNIDTWSNTKMWMLFKLWFSLWSFVFATGLILCGMQFIRIF